MSTVKTVVGLQFVSDLLKEEFPSEAFELHQLKGGEVAQAFSFKHNGSDLVIRVRDQETDGFLKDDYAYRAFGSDSLPIPRIIKTSTYSDRSYAISEKMPGKTLDSFPKARQKSLIPKIIETLHVIHSQELDKGNGFGDWDEEGIAHESSWAETLSNYFDREELRWEDRYRTTVFEKPLFDSLRARLSQMLAYLPNERHLLHADYGFDNLLSDGEAITGVIDWEHSAYGDFLYDIAWLDFWDKKIDYSAHFKDFYSSVEVSTVHWNYRLASSVCYFGAGALGFFAESQQVDKYKWTRGRLFDYLDSLGIPLT